MEIFKLKERFVNLATMYDSEFKTKVNRPYLIMILENKGRRYAIAMSTKSKSNHSFKLQENQFILYDKCFEVINMDIIECKYHFTNEMKYIPSLVNKNKNLITRTFKSYLIHHPTKFSINNKIMLDIQRKYKF